jgi:hypothetical protein
MEKLQKTLIDMRELLKSFTPSIKPKIAQTPPSIKTIQPPPLAPKVPAVPKLPGVAPVSSKDPKKMAEQLKNPTERKAKIEMLKVASNGQWTLEKVQCAASLL